MRLAIFSLLFVTGFAHVAESADISVPVNGTVRIVSDEAKGTVTIYFPGFAIAFGGVADSPSPPPADGGNDELSPLTVAVRDAVAKLPQSVEIKAACQSLAEAYSLGRDNVGKDGWKTIQQIVSEQQKLNAIAMGSQREAFTPVFQSIADALKLRNPQTDTQIKQAWLEIALGFSEGVK